MGRQADGSVRALAELLRDDALRVRQKAAEALGAIGFGVPSLVEAIERKIAQPPPEKDQEQRDRASFLRELVTALGRIGPEAKDALPVLRELLNSQERDFVRMEAAKAWAEIDLASATPILIPFLRKPARLDLFGMFLPQVVAAVDA